MFHWQVNVLKIFLTLLVREMQDARYTSVCVVTENPVLSCSFFTLRKRTPQD